MSDVCRVHRA